MLYSDQISWTGMNRKLWYVRKLRVCGFPAQSNLREAERKGRGGEIISVSLAQIFLFIESVTSHFG